MSTDRVTRGQQLLADGRADEAVELLRGAVAAGEEGAADLLAQAYFDSGRWSAAVDWLEAVVGAGHTEFTGRLGTALLGLGDVDAAEETLRRAVDDGDHAAANDLAILLHDDGRVAEARQVLERAVRSGDPTAPANLVELYLEAGQLDAAVHTAEEYRDDARPDTLVALADVRAVQRRRADAEQLYARAGELGATRAHTAFGLFLADLGDLRRAESEFRAAVDAAEPGWALTMGRFLVDAGRPDEAREFLQAAVDSGDDEALELLQEINGEDPGDD